MRDNIDTLLRNSLTPAEADTPNPLINQKILHALSEDMPMKIYIRRPAVAAVIAFIIIASGSLSAVAAWHYLSPAQVAREAGDGALAEAFQSKDAISINKTQTCGKYKITLYGMISGKSISSQLTTVDGGLQESRTYAVLSIERKDGSPMSPPDADTSCERESFTLSPFIQGQPTDKINLYCMDVEDFTCYRDGIRYKLLDCESLEIFADREVYLGITDTKELEEAAFVMDPDTGRIFPDKEYAGVNILFTLPMDKKKADTKKAEARLKTWFNYATKNAMDKNKKEEFTQYQKKMKEFSQWPAKKIEKECVYIEECTKNIKPDSEGMIHFKYSHEAQYADMNETVPYELEELTPGSSHMWGYGTNPHRVYFEVATKEKDGSYTIRVYYLDY